jgi:hypothetical protein
MVGTISPTRGGKSCGVTVVFSGSVAGGVAGHTAFSASRHRALTASGRGWRVRLAATHYAVGGMSEA